MTTPCAACHTDRSPRGRAVRGSVPAALTEELGAGWSIAHQAGAMAPPTDAPYDSSLNRGLDVRWSGDHAMETAPYDAVDWHALLRCGTCGTAWRARRLRTIVQRVTQDSGAPNFDPIAFAYTTRAVELRLERLPTSAAACLDATTVASFAEALTTGLFPVEGLWRPRLDALRRTDPEGLATLHEARRHDLPYDVREALGAWYRTLRDRRVPVLALQAGGHVESMDRPCPAVAMDDRLAWIATTRSGAYAWHAHDLARGETRTRILDLSGLRVNGMVRPTALGAQAVVYLQEGEGYGPPTGLALVDGDGTVRLLRAGLPWDARHAATGGRVSLLGPHLCVPLGRRLDVLEVSTGTPVFTVDGLPSEADGRVATEGDALVLGLVDGLAVRHADGTVTAHRRAGTLLRQDLDGLLVQADGAVERVFDGRLARASDGPWVAAHRDETLVALIGAHGFAVFDATALTPVGARQVAFGTLHGSGMTAGTIAVLGRSLRLFTAEGAIVREVGLDGDPEGLLTLPGIGFGLCTMRRDNTCVTLVDPSGRLLGQLTVPFVRELLHHEGWIGMLDTHDTIQVARR